MKKLLALAVSSIGFAAFSAEAKATESAAKNITANAVVPQIRIRIGNRNRNRRVIRTRTITRIVRVGRQGYRETIQTRYFPDSRTQTRVISRVRIR